MREKFWEHYDQRDEEDVYKENRKLRRQIRVLTAIIILIAILSII
jgi:hypothetical protein